MKDVHPPLVSGLSVLAPRYRAVLSDVWGVLHNGMTAFQPAHEALSAYRAAGGKVVLITNAPRPAGPIHQQLAGYGVPRHAYDDIVTSGDVTRDLLATRPERAVIHIGPDRDLTLYDGLPGRLADDAAGEIVSVTGLLDDDIESPDDYRDRLAALAARGLPMVCANPDIVVERGDKLVWCAGALARLYEEFGGEVIMLGKPFRPIYDAARARIEALCSGPLGNRDILAIGDGLPTDIRGADAQGFDVLFVTGGIHAADFGDPEAPDLALVAARLRSEGLGAAAVMPRLVW
ncbi:TIGR01459 family HAD-type hydrolase [Prosthecomicrobium hirschii]|uniref:TIGR01459 family HAD-type hydrolase n=1 Tax=Prosthecodimorpha hirschii TaxID=665126 RepID=UPI0022209C42|nr:TIGR01459 family HAD-type hydrolase [Prosthecomicrobium hirschii]MCW1840855.1 TIGR01459 family HAD-type hydrolase [Prosthecomicrobium hirschii]